ncbi:MAG: nickel-dependent lactate racemase [Desulfobacteraceae bacterium]
MEYYLKYQNGIKPIEIPEKANVTVLQPVAMPAQKSLSKALDHALASPLGCAPLSEQLRRKNHLSIAIAVPDGSQPVPVKALLPIIFQHMERALPHFEPAIVTIIIGSGLQPSPDLETIHRMIPSNLIRSCNVVIHDAHNALMKDFGNTHRGTPVKINAAFGEADFKMVIDLIDPHQFFGFTGGSKVATIGCASAESIRYNHRLINQKQARVGHLGDNPMREDLDEADRMIGIDFAVNVVLNTDKQVARVLAGEPQAVLERGAEICTAVYGVKLERKYDIILASCAGSPKDISAYQAQKGLNLVSPAVKEGGKILFLVAFQKGFGDDIVFDYVCPFAESEEVMKEFRSYGYTMGARKADLFGGTLVNYKASDFEDLDTAIMRNCHLRAANPSTIVKEWVDDFEGIPEVAVIPHAVTTYFLTSDDQ